MTAHRPGRLTIVVSGMVAGVPNQGGATWAVLQYLLGFSELGHDVYFLEPVPRAALAPAGADLASSTNASYCAGVMAGIGFDRRWALRLDGTDTTVGLSHGEQLALCRRADVLVNLSGRLRDEELTGPIPVRVYLDLDPAFTQLWHTVGGIDMGFASHTHHATVGLAVGDPSCPVPTGGAEWLATLPPVVLSHWGPGGPVAHDALTTVGHWRGYGSIEHGGVRYGQRAHSMRRLFDLPARAGERFMLALEIHPDERSDVAALESHGWRLVDPGVVAATPASYRRFVQASKAELGVAKEGYVVSRCGWFSDRSACYLASGRPVVAQDTGFSRYLPTGKGLFSFETADDVCAALDDLDGDYRTHRRAARELAEEHLDASKVLTRLLERVGASA